MRPVPYDAVRSGDVIGSRSLFVAALAIRLLYLWQIHGSPQAQVLFGDGEAYDLWARQIAAGDWLGREAFYQAPLYPYFLGVLYAVAGPSLLVVRLVQALLGSAACVLLAGAGERFFGRRAGLAAGALLALYPMAIYSDALIRRRTSSPSCCRCSCSGSEGFTRRRRRDRGSGWPPDSRSARSGSCA